MPVMFSIHGILRMRYNPLLGIRIRTDLDPDGQKRPAKQKGKKCADGFLLLFGNFSCSWDVFRK
jgi:hypothetical protein